MECTVKPYTKIYNTDLEVSFNTTEKAFNDLDKSQLKYLSQLVVVQKTIENIFHPPYSTMTIANEAFTYCSRIRLSVDKNTPRPNTACSFDTRIDLTLKNCLELTAPLTRKEFDTINKLYPKEPLIQKIKLFYQDLLTKLIYTFNIYPNSDVLKIKIKFKTRQEKEEWIKPEWLKKIETKEKEIDKKSDMTIRQ